MPVATAMLKCSRAQAEHGKGVQGEIDADGENGACHRHFETLCWHKRRERAGERRPKAGGRGHSPTGTSPSVGGMNGEIPMAVEEIDPGDAQNENPRGAGEDEAETSAKGKPKQVQIVVADAAFRALGQRRKKGGGQGIPRGRGELLDPDRIPEVSGTFE